MATIRRNYTMVEMVTVCAIILVLVGLGSGGYSLAQRKIKESRTQSLIKRIETALESCKAKHGFYPPAVTGEALQLDLGLDTSKPAQKAFLEDYRKAVDYEALRKSARESSGKFYILDAYGYPIYYRSPGLKNRQSFDLLSCGADGKVDGMELWSDGAFSVNITVKASDTNLQNSDTKNHDDIGNF